MFAERKKFLTFIEEHPDDAMARLVYADWLEEQGEDDEALRQRLYLDAKKWLMQLCKNVEDHYKSYDSDYYDEIYKFDYDRLIDMGHEATGPDHWFSCYNNQEMCDQLRDNRKTFWEKWSIVTGMPAPSVEDVSFSCGC